MKLVNYLVLILFAGLILINFGCKDEIPNPCSCNEDEVCLYDSCYLSEMVHSLNGTTIIAPNSYVGTISNNQCVDTLIFYNDTTRAIDNGRFGLIVPHYLGGIQNVAGSIPTVVSPSEYYLGSVAPLCYLNGEERYANLHFRIETDYVWMSIKFWTLNSEPDNIIDSCIVTFHRKI